MQHPQSRSGKRLLIPFPLLCFPFLLCLLCVPLADDAGAESATSDAFTLLMAARNARKLGAYDLAQQRYQRLLELRPDSWEARTEYGSLLIDLGKPDDALDQFAVAIRDHPAQPEAHERYLDALLALKRSKRAEEALRGYNALNPPEATLHRLQARLALLQLHYPLAADLFRTLEAEAIRAHDAERRKEAGLGLADTWTASDLHDRAGAVLGELRRAFPNDDAVLHRWIVNQALRGRLIEAYTELPKIQDLVLRERTEADLSNLSGRHFSAESRFRSFLRERPHDYGLLRGLAESLRGRGQMHKAAAVYQDLSERFPEDLQAKLDLAETYVAMRRYDQADRTIGVILAHDPSNLYGRYLRARLCSFRKDDACAGSATLDVVTSVGSLEDGRALGTVMRDRHHDHKGLIALAEHQLTSKGLYDRTLLADAVRAFAVTGRPRQGMVLVSSVREREPDPSFLDLQQAELAWADGDTAQVKALLRRSTDRIEKAALYYRLGAYQNAAHVCRTILERDPDNMQAFAWLVKSLAADDQVEAADEALSAWLPGKPRDARLALASILATATDGREPYYRFVLARWADLVQDTDPDDMDLRLARLTLSGLLRHYAEAVTGYRAVLATDPELPVVSLQVARLLAQRKDYEGAAGAYARHLQAWPDDLRAWREKARLWSWAGDLDHARDEYGALLAANPADDASALEYDAKQALWLQRYRLARSRYEALLAREPDNTEALFDSGQMLQARSQPEEARRYYRRVLVEMPGHREAALGLHLSELSQAPQGVMGIGYASLRGSGSLFAPLSISYVPVTVGEGEMRLSNNLTAGMGYQYVQFSQGQGLSVSHIERGSLRYTPTPFFHLDGFVSGLQYPSINRQSVNFGSGFSYEWLSGVTMRANFGRQDLWQNRSTIASGVFFDYSSIGVDLNVTDRIGLAVGGGYWHYSNSNENLNGQLLASYKILPFPHLLRLNYLLEELVFRRNVASVPPNSGQPAYFSPSHPFVKQSMALEYRYAWGYPAAGDYFPDPPRNRWSLTDLGLFSGWPTKPDPFPNLGRNTFSVSAGPSVDNFGNLYFQGNTTLSRAITSRLFLHASMLLIRAAVFNEELASGFLEYRF